jgi:hypothetical protein
MMQAEGRTLCSDIHKLVKYIWDKEELSQQQKKSIAVSVYNKGGNTNCSIRRGTSHP